MATTIRPCISEKNRYWIDRHRYYELKHFCLQYPIWRKAYTALDGYGARSGGLAREAKRCGLGDPTANCAAEKIFYGDRMHMVDRAAEAASPELAEYIFLAVTEGVSYEHLLTQLSIPCCREVFYQAYRRFFWLLSEARK